MHTFSKSVRDHALRSSCILKTLLRSVFKIYEDPHARSLTYTNRTVKIVLRSFLDMVLFKLRSCNHFMLVPKTLNSIPKN